MKVTKAVITAAGDNHSSLPLQNVVDREGRPGTALRRTLDEVVNAGIEEVAVIVRPGSRSLTLTLQRLTHHDLSFLNRTALVDTAMPSCEQALSSKDNHSFIWFPITCT